MHEGAQRDAEWCNARIEKEGNMSEPKVTVYTFKICRYCDAAKSLLQRHNIAFTEILVEADDSKTRAELQQRSGMKTFPQIFFGDQVIGGYTELKSLDEKVGLPVAFK